MPSASDFDAAAELLTQAAADVAVWAAGTRARFGPNTLAGGALTAVCLQAVDAAEHLATSTAEVLQERSDLCRQRAAAVRAYESALGEYHRATDEWRAIVSDLPPGVEPPASPRRPSKPAYAP